MISTPTINVIYHIIWYGMHTAFLKSVAMVAAACVAIMLKFIGVITNSIHIAMYIAKADKSVLKCNLKASIY